MQATYTTQVKREKESIHSGHFMISDFEAEEQDDEDEVAVPIPDVSDTNSDIVVRTKSFTKNSSLNYKNIDQPQQQQQQQQLAIDTSLAKLFQCMSLAYRQKLTSPKWNRFRGIRLRWKDKIRLNNVIWRCWHLQFIKKENTLICQFASPLDVDTHNKPEAVVLEGKYWKRKLAAVTAEYKKWRMYYRNHLLGHTIKEDIEMLNDTDLLTWNSQSSENMHMMVDEDYMGLMSDTLFSTITNQPFVFPDSREIAKAGLADFIQPSLGPLQPNLDDYVDTFEPLQEFVSGKLPTVLEEQAQQWNYSDLVLINSNNNLQVNSSMVEQFQQQSLSQLPTQTTVFPNDIMLTNSMNQFASQLPDSSFSVISKNTKSDNKSLVQHSTNFNDTLDNNLYNYTSCTSNVNIIKAPEQISQSSLLHHKSQFTTPVVSTQLIQSTSNESPSFITDNLLFTKETKLNKHIKHRSNKQRSRSNTREPIKRPPLVSAASDSSLLNQNNSVLLTQLLTKNVDNSNFFNRTQNILTTTTITTTTTAGVAASATTTISNQLTKQILIKEENNKIQLLPSQLPQTTPTTLILTPININSIQQSHQLSGGDSISFSNSASPVLDSVQSLSSPTSSQGSIGSPSHDNTNREQKRVGHIHAEQKRRYNIKNGFDMIHQLIPHLNQNPNAKLSKAAMLQKGAEYIRQLKSERNQLKDEMDCLRQQIETLNTSISNCQSMLPATGAPVSRRGDNKMQEMFDTHVRNRTMENWKYWIFSLLFRPLLVSFNNIVSTSSLEDLYRSTMLWIEQHCTLVDLRPVVLNSLRYLCTKTDILSEPDKLSDEARQIVLLKNQT